MPRHTRWSDLLVGLVALGAIVALSVIVLVFARIGAMHGDTFQLYASVGAARGVIHGTEVWLAGQKVGIVKEVRALTPSAQPQAQLLIVMDVLESARPHIRLDSHAQIRSGGSLIGAPVVYVNVGTAAARAVQPEDTLRSLPEPDYETVASRFAVASRQFPQIISNMKLLDAQLHSVQGTLGAMGVEQGGVELPVAQRRLTRLSTALGASRGTVGRALGARASLTARANLLMARSDSIRRLLASPHTTYGRFRRDSTLLREIGNLRAQLDTVRAEAASPNGTLGRLKADSVLLRGIAHAQRDMASLFTDIQQHPFRYLSVGF
ncbi:MAG TPA: MlaD family protein [Gemmatimonadaceae bacterium]|nr:MlaD family protein [Gemmatimonadaceae bacterium]